jgi:pilus assembly protein CpaB
VSLRLVVAALILATAVALGMIAYQIASPPRLTLHMGASEPAPGVLAQTYLAAARALPPGTLIRASDIAIGSAAIDHVPAGAIPDSADARAAITGALVTQYMEAGAPLMEADILRLRDRGFLAAVLAPGTRAVSIGVDAVTGVSGLIWPGDRVDVILTQELDKAVAPLSRRVLSETVLRDIRVIAIDQEIVQGTSSGATSAGHQTRTVTLQVAPDQAEKLSVADRLGHLSLSIRSITNATTDPSTPPTVFGEDVSPALSRTNQPAGARVQVIQGDKRSEVNFR